MPGTIVRLRQPPPSPAWANRCAATLYASATALYLLLLVSELLLARSPGPHGATGFVLLFLGGAAAYAGWFAWAAWHVRPLHERARLPLSAVLPLLLHGLVGAAVAAWMLLVKFHGELADRWLSTVGNTLIDAALLAVALGWLPGVLLWPVARGGSALAAAGFGGVLWIGLLMATFG